MNDVAGVRNWRGRFRRALRDGLDAVTCAEWAVMAPIVALSSVLNFWRLSAVGYGNEYYSAAVWSMAHSWRAFWFAGFDSGGFISVDKPPLGLWLQVMSVKLLGFSGFSLLAPEALAGVLAVIVLWRVTRRVFGAPAGVLAALALAVTPVSVVSARDNILEPALVLTLLLAAWALLAAVERQSWGWLLASAALVGLGFNIKTLEAYLVVPAFALYYLVCARESWRARAARLAVAGALMSVVSLAWMVAVDLTPASQRPYVGSSAHDSELELALGYNGILRLTGALTAPGVKRGALLRGPSHGPVVEMVQHAPGLAPRPLPSPAGAAGALRLLQPPLGSQVSWLLPLALVGLVLALVIGARPDVKGAEPAERDTRERWRRGALLWGGWLGVCVVAFSYAHSINSYYVAVLAPAVSALAAAGAVTLWRGYRGAGWQGYGLVAVIMLTGVEQANLKEAAPGWGVSWLTLTLWWGAVALGLAGLRLGIRWWAEQSGQRLAGWSVISMSTSAALAFSLLLLTPYLWSAASLTPGNGGGWPVAGPAYASTAVVLPRTQVDARLVRYLEVRREHDAYLVGTVDAYLASPLILATGQPVMIMGGFSGRDPVLTPTELARLVANDDVTFFLVSSANVSGSQTATPPQAGLSAPGGAYSPSTGKPHYTNALTQWVSGHCALVPAQQWSSASPAQRPRLTWALFSCE